jgi:MFS family permease
MIYDDIIKSVKGILKEKSMSNIKVKDPTHSWYHWMVVAACVIVMGVSGGMMFNCVGLFYTPISEDLGIGRGNVALFATIVNIVGGFMGPLIAKVMTKVKIKVMMLSGSVLMSTMLMLLSLAQNIYVFYIIAVFIGIGAYSISLIPCTIIVSNWFEQKKGFATGLTLTSTGIGGAIFSPIINSLIKNVGWRLSFVFEGAVILILTSLAIIFVIRLTPEEIGLRPYGASADARNDASKVKIPEGKISLTPIFAVMCLIAVLTAYISGINSHFPGIAVENGMDSEVGAYMISATMIGNITCKILHGLASDRFGAVNTSIVIVLISVVSLLILTLLRPSNMILALIAALLYGSIHSMNSVGISLVTRNLFGAVNYSKCYSVVNIFSAVGYACSLSLIGFIYDATLSYYPALVIGLISGIAILVLLLAAKKHRKLDV